MSKLHYQALQKLIQQNNGWFTPSELHGILTALTIFQPQADWKTLLAINHEDAIAKLIPELQHHIEQHLASNNLDYQLLLADEEALSLCAESLAMWAQGFILAMQYLRENQQLPKLDDSSQEFCQDLAEIAKLDSTLANTEENHRQLMELEEHSRLGALMLFASMRKRNLN